MNVAMYKGDYCRLYYVFFSKIWTYSHV